MEREEEYYIYHDEEARLASMEQRSFYEEYFRERTVREPEIEKQWSRINRLKKEIRRIESPGLGLFVGIGGGEEMDAGRGTLVGVDLPFGKLHMSQKEHPESAYVCGDGRVLPFRNGLFDYAVCSEVIEHVKERNQILRELARVLKADGTVVLSTPNWWSLYGIFRLTYQVIARTEFNAGNQPLDQWSTPVSFMKEVQPYFKIGRIRGSWYWPPTGKGSVQVLPRFFGGFFHMLQPIDALLGAIFPRFGHSIWIVGRPRKILKGDRSDDAFDETVGNWFSSRGARLFFYLWLVFFGVYGFSKAKILEVAWHYIQCIGN